MGKMIRINTGKPSFQRTATWQFTKGEGRSKRVATEKKVSF